MTVPIFEVENHEGVFKSCGPGFLFLDTALFQFGDTDEKNSFPCGPNDPKPPPSDNPNTVYLTIKDPGDDFSDFAETPNQKAVARGLDAAREAATDDLAV